MRLYLRLVPSPDPALCRPYVSRPRARSAHLVVMHVRNCQHTTGEARRHSFSVNWRLYKGAARGSAQVLRGALDERCAGDTQWDMNDIDELMLRKYGKWERADNELQPGCAAAFETVFETVFEKDIFDTQTVIAAEAVNSSLPPCGKAVAIFAGCDTQRLLRERRETPSGASPRPRAAGRYLCSQH